jgi:hypothetical protein
VPHNCKSVAKGPPSVSAPFKDWIFAELGAEMIIPHRAPWPKRNSRRAERCSCLATPRSWLFAVAGSLTILPLALRGDDWPPTLDLKNPVVQTLDGRTIEHYEHGPRASWGYPAPTGDEWGYHAAKETGPKGQNQNTFYLVAPKVPRNNAPLCVVLHSANRTGYEYLSYASLGSTTDGCKDPTTVMTNSPDDFYALYLSSTNAEWWGWSAAGTSEDRKRGINAPSPAERRVLDTIEWVVEQRHIDRNRIYLCGVSMGGCGTLGIGLPNGNIFAAIRATVPGGTAYGSYRFAGVAGIGPIPSFDSPPAEIDAWKRRAAGVGMPDPPFICDFSSEADGWALTQPPLVYAAHFGHLPLVLTWGNWGHITFGERMLPETICQVGLAFPWLEIRKNEAYPVFTGATCDQRNPWFKAPISFNSSGVMNAYFRWKNIEDTPGRFRIQLWMDHPQIPGPTAAEGKPAGPPVIMPDSATADLTFRRFQQFKVTPGASYAWSGSQNGKVLLGGEIMPDYANLLTIPGVSHLSTSPIEVSLQPK